MRVYIQLPSSGAGRWIYKGFYSAWEELGYSVNYFTEMKDIVDRQDFYLMTHDGFGESNFNVIQRAAKTFLFVQPIKFPYPWGAHPNFVSACNPEIIKQLSEMKKVIKWTFVNYKDNKEVESNYALWKDVNIFPLAFDSVNYELIEEEPIWDVCFVGGAANNGFNEKVKIMNVILTEFTKTELKYAFFVNKYLSHEDENKLLSLSKVALNIHDAYQRKLQLDTNERTFKSLGLTGCLVSDQNKQIDNLFPQVKMSNDPKEMIQCVTDLINNKSLNEIKKESRNAILNGHTYVDRVKRMLEL